MRKRFKDLRVGCAFCRSFGIKSAAICCALSSRAALRQVDKVLDFRRYSKTSFNAGFSP